MRTNIASDDHHKNDISNYANNHHIDDHIFDGANDQLIHNSMNNESDVNDLIKKAEIDSQLFSKSLVINKMPEIPFNIQLLKTETKNGKLYAEMSDSIFSADFVISKMYSYMFHEIDYFTILTVNQIQQTKNKELVISNFVVNKSCQVGEKIGFLVKFNT